jgi:hypothetical protein
MVTSMKHPCVGNTDRFGLESDGAPHTLRINRDDVLWAIGYARRLYVESVCTIRHIAERKATLGAINRLQPLIVS